MEPVIVENVSALVNISTKDDADSSDDEGIFLKRNSVKTKLFDSDEEASAVLPKSNAESEVHSDSESIPKEELKTKSRLKVMANQFDIDSEENASESEVNEESKITSSPKRISHLVESGFDDSERLKEESFNVPVSSPNEAMLTDKVNTSPLKQVNLFAQSDLYDAEGSSDEELVTSKYDSKDENKDLVVEERRKDKSRKEKPKNSKSKPLKDELQNIHSESQRMVRESRVSLPYHRPRQRTLAEFLQRRKNTMPPVKSLKTSPGKLGAFWKTLEQKAKEAEEFYKSDSEPENEENKNEPEEVKDTPTNISDNDKMINILEGDNAENNISLNNPSVVSIRHSDVKRVLFSETEKSDSLILNNGLDASVKSHATSNGMEVCSEAGKNDINKMEHIKDLPDIAVISTDPSISMDSIKENHLPEEDSEKKSSEINAMDVENETIKKLSRLGADSNQTKEDIELNFNNVLKESETLTLSDADSRSSLRNITETNVDKTDDELQDKLPRAKSPLESEIMSVADKSEENLRKAAELPELDEAESMSLRLDEDSCDVTKQNPISSMEDDNLRTSNSLPVTKEKDLKSCEENSVPDVIQKTLSEVPEHPLDCREQLLKSAGIFLSSQLLPCLKADSDVIDLDEDVRANPEKEVGVRDLMQRFIKHHIPKKPKNEEKKVDVGIVVVEGGGDQGPEKVKKEIMTVTVGGNDPLKYPSSGVERPGARLKSLREELQREIARKRDEEWTKRQQELLVDDEENEDGEKCNLDEEEEEEMTESSSSEEEEEEEDEIEDDVDMSTKNRPKSQFVDDEAEESEDEGEMDNDDRSSLGEEADVKDEDLLDEDVPSKEKLTKEDANDITLKSNDGEIRDSVVKSPAKKERTKFQRVKTFDLFCSQSDNEDELDMMNNLKTPPCTPFSQSDKDDRSEHICLPSPALPLTALQGPGGCMNWQSSGQLSPWTFTRKSLFIDEESPKQQKVENDESKDGKSALRGLIGMSQDSQVNEDELLNLMSGKFLSRATKIDEVEDDDFCLALEDSQELFDKSQLTSKVKEESFVDYQKLDDSKTSGKDNWGNHSFLFNRVDEEDDDDDDIGVKNSLETSQKRKKPKKITISDDEDEEEKREVDGEADKSEDEDETEEEVENEASEEEVESELEEEEGVERIVEYDSEENAVVVEERREVKKSRARRGLEFLENEAELSEGEEEYMGSGDEDERGLNRFEKEEGDADRLDDELVRRELGRIHMRQVLDEDKREVRLLQEIFLEDGELHSEGQGRERKFRWRNIDNMDDGALRPMDSGDEDKGDEEDENEEEWRRLRHERETWLREHKNDTIEDTTSILDELGDDSKILKLGQAALRRINPLPNNTLRKWLIPASGSKDKEKEAKTSVVKEPESPEIKRPFQMLSKRGSFLARKDGALERLAEIAIKSAGGVEPVCLTSTSPVVTKTKNSRGFVFTILSPQKKDQKADGQKAPINGDSQPVKKNTKRKRIDISQNAKPAKKTKSVKVGSIFQFL